uniref:Paraneoplastic antigen Ma-like C-terminal domain-containing protein n=1 Tax=Amphilophus citrinellus TaxID=61819 RepID=A0A3Q0RBQ3_AMPCI
MVLNRAAANRICTTHKEPATSTPSLEVKAQPLTDPRPTAVSSDKHPSTSTEALNADSVLVNLVPGDVQRVIVEHIVKHDPLLHPPSTLALHAFSGKSPKPSAEVEYNIWRLRVKQVVNDPTLSEGHQRRMILDSLASPALNVALSIGSQVLPKDYLNELDKAYGNVTRGEELYIQFLKTHQNTGEKASDYLRRLQTLLGEVVDSNGIAKADFDSQLLKQFLRGCWDDTLITALHLKDLLEYPHKAILTFSELLFKIGAYEKESHLKEVCRKRHMCGNSSNVHARTVVNVGDCKLSSNAPTVLDAHTREQLEERIQQLEAELMNNSASGKSQFPRNDKTTQRPTQKAKPIGAAPPTPVSSSGDHRRVRKFCYNSGEDSHMLPQCSNPTNAILVQKKLCERHNARQSQCSINQHQNSPQSDLPLNR